MTSFRCIVIVLDLLRYYQTRSKLKEAFDLHTAAVIERAEKQIILARHARRLLNYIDDSPVVPGDTRRAYDHELEARQVLEDAENDLRAWEPRIDPIATADIHTSGINGANDVSHEDRESLANDTDAGHHGGNGDSERLAEEGHSSARQLSEPQSSGGLNPEAEPVVY